MSRLIGRPAATAVRAPLAAGVPAAPLLEAQHAELAAHFGEAYRSDPTRFDPAIAEQIEAGFAVPATRMVALAALRDAIVRNTATLFETVDLLLCPTVPVEPWSLDVLGPPTIGGRPAGPRGHAVFTPLFNQAGVPALSVPCGWARRDCRWGCKS